jgi:hypothetical protein
MTDAYLPPRQDADEPPAPAPATWTIRSVLRGMLATAHRQPLMMFLTVFAIPLLWSVPSKWMQDRIVPENAADLGPDRPLLWIVVPWLATAWETIVIPGSQLASLRATAGEPIRFADFVTGLRKLPILLLVTLIPGVPLLVVEQLRLPTPYTELAFVSVFFGSVVFMARTLLWWPLLLLTTLSFFESFALSWTATRGQTLRLLGLVLALAATATPFIIVDVSMIPNYIQLSWGVIGALLLLAAAQVYVVLAPQPKGAGLQIDRA